MIDPPEWDAPAAAMEAWVNEMLDGMDRDDGDLKQSDLLALRKLLPGDGDAAAMFKSAVEQADRGDVEPLQRLYPEIAKYLSVSKLRRGQRRRRTLEPEDRDEFFS